MKNKKNILKEANVLLITLFMVLSTVMMVTGNEKTETLNWSIETVDSTGNVGLFTSIVLDSSNLPHISYYALFYKDLKYAYYDGSWHTEIVDSTGDVGRYTSIALDSSDNPHIGYHCLMPTDLKYACFNGSWHTEIVDSSIGVGSYTSIALDSSDNPRISYYGNGILNYTYFDGSWHIETVDSIGDVGKYNSIALDSNDYPHISYYYDDFYGNGFLKYGYFDGSWHIETVDSSIGVGSYSSIALDSSDNPHISYYDDYYDDLKYAYFDGTWHNETVDSIGDVGKYNSIALDSSDNPHISYYDASNLVLKYAMAGNQPPTVSITSPSTGTVSGNILIQGTASDSDGTVMQVEINIDSGTWLVATGTTSWSKDWDTTTVSEGTHTIYARSKDNYGAYSTEDFVTVIVNNINQLPEKPVIYGESHGDAGTSYEYTFNAVDPDEDNVKYHIDWGDGNSETTGFNPSGSDVKVKHIWSTQGTYTVKVTAEDTYGLVGPEGTLDVTMPRNKIINTPFLNYLQNTLTGHPNLFPILQQLILRFGLQ